MKKRITMLLSLSIALTCSYIYTVFGMYGREAEHVVKQPEIKSAEPIEYPKEILAIGSSCEKFQQRYSMDWGIEDAEMLKKIAMAEAEGESTEGKALVMLVVLNRMVSDEFPDTVEGVIFQENQFSTVETGGRYWTTIPNEDCDRALRMIEQGYDESYGALYFESVSGESWHSQNLEYLFQKGNHRFYK